MPPELAEPKFVQGFADIHVRLPLISELSGLGSDFGIHWAKVRWYLVFWSLWFRSWQLRFLVGNQEYPN